MLEGGVSRWAERSRGPTVALYRHMRAIGRYCNTTDNIAVPGRRLRLLPSGRCIDERRGRVYCQPPITQAFQTPPEAASP